MKFQQVVPGAVAFWETVLQIPHTVGPIKLNRKCQDNQYFLSDSDPNQVIRKKSKFLTLWSFLLGVYTSTAKKHVCQQTVEKCWYPKSILRHVEHAIRMA